jgi:hypothetical protein
VYDGLPVLTLGGWLTRNFPSPPITMESWHGGSVSWRTETALAGFVRDAPNSEGMFAGGEFCQFVIPNVTVLSVPEPASVLLLVISLPLYGFIRSRT